MEWEDKAVEGWSGPEDDEELISLMLKAKSSAAQMGQRASVTDLWKGDKDVLAQFYPHKSNDYDYSSADQALCTHLAFWTGKNPERMKRLFERSGLVRDKWQDREDYQRNTIDSAIGWSKEVYSTKKEKDTEEGSKTYCHPAQQVELFKGCVYVRDIHKIFTPDGSFLKPDQFRAVYGGHNFVMGLENTKTTRSAWEAFTESQCVKNPKVHTTCFRPEVPSGEVIEEEGLMLVNTYVPIRTPRKVGDVTPFRKHLELLLPVEEDRKALLAYMAACVQYPGVKFQWAPLLQGVEGNGKTMLVACLARAVGLRYTHMANATDLDNKFNSWVSNKLLIGIEEVRITAGTDALEVLKTLITNSFIEIQGKGRDQVTGDNRANLFMCSNYKDSTPKTSVDRRFGIFFTAQQTVEDIKKMGGHKYFSNFHTWLHEQNGFAYVTDYLYKYVIPEALNPARGHRAPITSSTEEAISASLGAIEQEILEAIEEGRVGFRNGWVSSKQLSILLIGRKVNPRKRAEALKTLGYIPHPHLPNGGRSTTDIPLDDSKSRLYIKKGSLLSTKVMPPQAIISKYVKDQVGGGGEKMAPSPYFSMTKN
jgi:hypothetical protein